MYGVETFTEVVLGAGLHGLCYNIDAVAKQKGASVRQIICLAGALTGEYKAIVVYERPIDMDGEADGEEI